MAQELTTLARIFDAPARPLAAILGGAKVSDKLALIESLLGRVDRLLVAAGWRSRSSAPRGTRSGDRSSKQTWSRQLAAPRSGAGAGVDFRLPVDTVVATSPDAAAGRVVESGAIPPT